MSVSRNNNDQLLNQQIALLKQVTNKKQQQHGQKRQGADGNRYQKFFSSQNNIQSNHSYNNVSAAAQAQLANQVTGPLPLMNNLNQSYNEGTHLRDSSLLKKKDNQIIADKIFLPQNMVNSSQNLQYKSSKTPDIASQNIIQSNQVMNSANSGLYQQIKGKNSQMQEQKLNQLIKDARIESEGKKAICKFQQSNTKRSSRGDASGKNSQKNTKYENFFSQRNGVGGVMPATSQNKDQMKQVIKIYKDGVNPEGLSSQRKSLVETNLKGQVAIGRNLSVPRGAHHAGGKQSNLISSQDYSNMPHAYRDSKIIQKIDRSHFNNTENLNNSVSNVKMNDLNFTYGNENLNLGLEDTFKQSALMSNGTANMLSGIRQQMSYSKQKTTQSILQGQTLKSCNCPCSCAQNNQETSSQTNNMTSILSQQNKRGHYNNNTITLRFGNGYITTTGGQSTTVQIDEQNDSNNMEDMHYLMINIEKMKKKMLGCVEGLDDPSLDYELFYKMQSKEKEKGNNGSPDRSSLENSNINVVCFE